MRIVEHKRRRKLTFPADAFVFTWDSTLEGGDRTLTLPTNSLGVYDFTVDWGDGSPVQTVDAWDSANRVHTYTTDGIKTITCTGSMTEWGGTAGGYYSYVRWQTIEHWGNVVLKESGAFNNMDRLHSVNDDDLNAGNSVDSIFSNLSSLTTFAGFKNPVKNPRSALQNTGVTGAVTINIDSTSTYIDRCFMGCSGLTSITIEGDTISVNEIQYFMDGCTGLTTFNWNATGGFAVGCNMAYSFRNCSALTSFPMIDVSNVDDFQYAWYGCSGLTTFPTLNTSSGTTFVRTWSGCTGLTQAISLDFSSAIDMNYAFASAYDINANVVVPDNTTTGNVSNWANAFEYASMYEMGSWNYSGCTTDFNMAFYRCDAVVLRHQDLSTITNLHWSYRYMQRLVSPDGFTLNTTSPVFTESTWAQNINMTTFPPIDTSMVSDFRATWWECTSLNNFPALDCTGATELISTFWKCSSLDTIGTFDVSTITNYGVDVTYGLTGGVFELCGFVQPPNWDYSACTDNTRMFASNYSMTSVPDTFDLPNCTYSYRLFADCDALTSVSATSPLRLLPHMVEMFGYCNGLTTFPNWDLSNKVIDGLFRNCINITTLPDFNITGVTSLTNFFHYLTSLTAYPNLSTGAVVNWDSCFASQPLSTPPAYDFSSGETFNNFNSYGGWVNPNLNLPSALDLSSAFYNNDSVQNLTISAPLCTNWDSICEYADNLVSIDFGDVSNALSMRDAFRYGFLPNDYDFPTLNLDSATDLWGFMAFGSKISTQSCTDLLIYLEANNPNSNVTIEFSSTTTYFTAQAQTAVDNLVARGWNVYSGGGI
jgi:hypothetical protein